MPKVKVGKKVKEFPYTEKGMMMARQYAKKMGGTMMNMMDSAKKMGKKISKKK